MNQLTPKPDALHDYYSVAGELDGQQVRITHRKSLPWVVIETGLNCIYLSHAAALELSKHLTAAVNSANQEGEA